MWEKFRRFHKNDDSGQLEQMRFMYGLMGAALGFFTGWYISQGSEWTVELLVMALLAGFGIVGFLTYSKLVRERTSSKP